jgi:triphosphoribosyl-dephospho-CoA synthase
LALSTASVLEASVPKPGNASPSQDVEGVRYTDVVLSALVMEPKYREACLRGARRSPTLMDLLHEGVKGTERFSILGTALLLLPLAYSSPGSEDVRDLTMRAGQLVRTLSQEDWKWFRKVLLEISPSYLGKEDRMDYREENLRMGEVLQWSTNVDEVSREMVRGYPLSMEVYRILKRGECGSFVKDVQSAFIYLLSVEPDGLIVRKRGGRVALQVSKMASKLSKCPKDEELEAFNSYLKERGLNPGSTADLIASGIALYELEPILDTNVRSTLPGRCDR